MKSLLRIIRRYSLTVGIIIFMILTANFCVICGLGYYHARRDHVEENVSGISWKIMEEVEKELQKNDGVLRLSGEGRTLLEESEFLWVMALDEEGTVVWEWNLPAEVSRHYRIQDVAGFSRWYLADDPVKVLAGDEYLLVFGCNPQQVARYSMLLSASFLKNIPLYVHAALLINLLLIVVFILCFGYRFYGSMKPIAQGIEDLAAQQPVHLQEKGMTAELAEKLNETSGRLLMQSRALAKRDSARTEWIAGVSHDIRTPLSLIVGHSDRLAKDPQLSRENRMLAENIRRQSLLIRQLIADLNLTSRLAYQAQALKTSRCFPASLLRSCVSDFYNAELEEGNGEKYEFEVIMKEEMEQVWMEADEGLLLRAFRNLLGNSVRHNPDGCRVTAALTEQGPYIVCAVRDTGGGIPERVVKGMQRQDMEQQSTEQQSTEQQSTEQQSTEQQSREPQEMQQQNIERPASSVHIMGLRVADQIAKAHGGRLEFEKRAEGNYDVKILFCSR